MAIRVLDHRSPLGKLARTPNGGARVPATLMRPGFSTYFAKDGSKIVHYTPKEVVAQALDSARDAVVTYNHPKEREVNPSNADRETRGHVRSDSLSINDEGILVGELVINSGALLDAIEQGIAREISPGYDIEGVAEKGVVDGQEYDFLRTKVTFNHFAGLKSGRQGRAVRLLLDSESSTYQEEDEVTMKIIIDGQEVSPEAVQGRIDGLVETAKGLRAQVESLTAKLNDATDEAKFQARVNDAAEKLVAKREEEKRVNDAKEAAEKKAAENLAKAKAKFPKMVLDGKSAEYIEGLLANDSDGVIAMAGGTEGTAAPAPTADKDKKANDAEEEVDARTFQRRQTEQAWQLPIPGSMTAKGIVAG